MYNTCVGETIPYFSSPGSKLPRAKFGSNGRLENVAVLAVWPPDADVSLRPVGAGGEAGAHLDGPWRGGPGEIRVDQLRQIGPRGIASVTPSGCGSCADLWSDDGQGWRLVDGLVRMGPRRYEVLAFTDLDDDHHPEAIIFEDWANDYGLRILGNDWTKIAWGFSCGNI